MRYAFSVHWLGNMTKVGENVLEFRQIQINKTKDKDESRKGEHDDDDQKKYAHKC